MKVTHLVIALLLIGILGAAGLFYYQSQQADLSDLGRVDEDLRALQRLDAQMDQLALRSRFGLDGDYDELSRVPARISELLAGLAAGPFAAERISGTLVDRHFRTLSSTLVAKIDAVENFKSHNSILRNSVAYAPQAGEELAVVAEQNGMVDLAGYLRRVTRDLLAFSLVSGANQNDALASSVNDLEGFDQSLPEAEQIKGLQFLVHARTVLQEKPTTDRYLAETLAAPTEQHLNSLQAAYTAQIERQAAASRHFNLALAGYIGLLLAGFLFVAYKLRRLYVTLDAQVKERTSQIQQAYEELKASQQRLIQSEKMASLGQMVAGVAHEINTPLGYVRNNMVVTRGLVAEIGQLAGEVQASVERMKVAGGGSAAGIDTDVELRLQTISRRAAEVCDNETLKDVQELLDDAVDGVDCISDLVKGLKDFSRMDQAKIEKVDLHDCIESALTIANHVIKDKAEIVREYGTLPPIRCAPSQINQVLLNLLTNAAQAIEGRGHIRVATSSDFDNVYVRIRDTGTGIAPEVRGRIFDPMFTTKPVGEGMGMGLAICWNIIADHGGTIDVKSRVGVGTEFTVSLPLGAGQYSGVPSASAGTGGD